LEGQYDPSFGDGLWSLSQLQAYIAHVKTIKPQLTEESKRLMTAYYQRQRKSDLQDSAR